ncbi:MAG TPA: hypothetical protein VHN98_01810 [Acidimicrobiales bacterium]|nr:hypothetical protein [Acidimicrobiales bacterium]
MTDTVTRTCSRCGATADAPEGGLPEGWSLESNERGIGFLCGTCVRANIRSIEGKLPEEYWER